MAVTTRARPTTQGVIDTMNDTVSIFRRTALGIGIMTGAVAIALAAVAPTGALEGRTVSMHTDTAPVVAAPTPVPMVQSAPEPTTTTTVPAERVAAAPAPVPTIPPVVKVPQVGKDNNGLQSGHWTQDTAGTIHRDPSPGIAAEDIQDPSYAADLEAKYCADHAALCGPNDPWAAK